MTSRHILTGVIAVVAGIGALLLSDAPFTLGGGLMTRAEARIGRPLTPMSYAGVARRTTRRAVAGAAVAGAAAVGLRLLGPRLRAGRQQLRAGRWSPAAHSPLHEGRSYRHWPATSGWLHARSGSPIRSRQVCSVDRGLDLALIKERAGVLALGRD
jgi:hypothetical protein